MSNEVQLVKFEHVIHLIKDNITINDACRCRRPVRSHSASHRNIQSLCTFRQRCPETKHPCVSGLQFIAHITNTTKHELSLDAVHALPLINSQAHEWKTLVTSLMQLHKLNILTRGHDSTRPVCVWLNMDLYKRVLKLTCLYPELYEDKWIASPGQFHIVLCALRCLGQTVDGRGLDIAWVEADICSNVTVMQIINGSHHNRAIECHLFTLQALTDMWLDAFFAKHPDVYKSLEITLHRLW